MEGDGFEVNSRDICLMCLCSCPPFNINRKRQVRISTFKLLMHFLEINVMEVFDFPAGFLGETEEELDNDNACAQLHALVNTCDKCLSVIGNISNAFEEYEAIRARLDEYLKILLRLMVIGGRNKELVQEYQRQMGSDFLHDQIARKLRKETLQKCRAKIKQADLKTLSSDPVHLNTFSTPVVRTLNDNDNQKPISKLTEEISYTEAPISSVLPEGMTPDAGAGHESEKPVVNTDEDNPNQDINSFNGLKILIKTEELEFEPEEPEDYYDVQTPSSSTHSTPLTLSALLDNDTGPLKNPTCRVCGVTFSSFKALQGHMSSHTTRVAFKGNCGPKCRGPGLSKSGKPRLPCPTCGKYFSSNITLWRHNRDVHAGFVARACDYCLKNYPSSSLYRRHLKTHHPREYFSKFVDVPKEVTDVDIRQVVVNFSSEWHNEDHNIFKCNHCKQRSNMKANVVTHMLLIHVDILVERLKEFLTMHNYEVKEHRKFTSALDYRMFEDNDIPYLKK